VVGITAVQDGGARQRREVATVLSRENTH
jgi:hypothetical protein